MVVWRGPCAFATISSSLVVLNCLLDNSKGEENYEKMILEPFFVCYFVFAQQMAQSAYQQLFCFLEHFSLEFKLEEESSD